MKIYVNGLDFKIVKGIDVNEMECYALMLEGRIMHIGSTEKECVGIAGLIEIPRVPLQKLC